MKQLGVMSANSELVGSTWNNTWIDHLSDETHETTTRSTEKEGYAQGSTYMEYSACMGEHGASRRIDRQNENNDTLSSVK